MTYCASGAVVVHRHVGDDRPVHGHGAARVELDADRRSRRLRHPDPVVRLAETLAHRPVARHREFEDRHANEKMADIVNLKRARKEKARRERKHGKRPFRGKPR